MSPYVIKNGKRGKVYKVKVKTWAAVVIKNAIIEGEVKIEVSSQFS
jgi:hypothetical protein